MTWMYGYGVIIPLAISSKILLFYSYCRKSFYTFIPVGNIWKTMAPSRVRAFSWLVCFNRVNTMDVLQRRPFMCLSLNICVLCGSDGESSNHLFLHCRYARRIWTYFFDGLNVNWVMPENIRGFLLSWVRIGKGGGVR